MKRVVLALVLSAVARAGAAPARDAKYWNAKGAEWTQKVSKAIGFPLTIAFDPATCTPTAPELDEHHLAAGLLDWGDSAPAEWERKLYVSPVNACTDGRVPPISELKDWPPIAAKLPGVLKGIRFYCTTRDGHEARNWTLDDEKYLQVWDFGNDAIGHDTWAAILRLDTNGDRKGILSTAFLAALEDQKRRVIPAFQKVLRDKCGIAPEVDVDWDAFRKTFYKAADPACAKLASIGTLRWPTDLDSGNGSSDGWSPIDQAIAKVCDDRGANKDVLRRQLKKIRLTLRTDPDATHGTFEIAGDTLVVVGIEAGPSATWRQAEVDAITRALYEAYPDLRRE